MGNRMEPKTPSIGGLQHHLLGFAPKKESEESEPSEDSTAPSVYHTAASEGCHGHTIKSHRDQGGSKGMHALSSSRIEVETAVHAITNSR